MPSRPQRAGAPTRPVRPFGQSKRLVDDLHLARRRGVVRVNLRRLEVGVAEVLLDGAQRHAGCGERGRERVPQILEADGRTPASTQAAWNRRVTFVRSRATPSSGWAKTRSSSSLKTVRNRHSLELGGESVRHRHRALGAEIRLALAGVLVADPRVADADPLGRACRRASNGAREARIGAARVVAAARMTSRSTGPSASRSTVRSGIAAITASSSGKRQELQVGIRVAFPPPPRPRGVERPGSPAPTHSLARRAQRRSAGTS